MRKIDPSTPRRVAPRGRPPYKKPGPGMPPVGLLVAAVAVLAGIIVLVVMLVRGSGGEEEPEASSLAPAASAMPEGVVSQAPASAAPAEPEPAAIPEPDAPGGAPEEYGSVAVIDGAGYEYYKFSEEDTNEYIQLVCDAADSLPESASLYAMVVPTALDVLLPESYITEYEIDSSDQRKAIEDYIYPSMHNLSDRVQTVSLFDPLRRHCDEYIYYRSDPLWTQLGAYYGYVEFCKAAGLEALSLDDFDYHSYSGYLGSLYHATGSESLAANPDTMEAYFPPAEATLSFTDRNGETQSGWSVIQDGESYDASLLNLIFMAGGQPYAEITNEGRDDGSACILVSESSSNLFAPFLAEHYQYVYVVDYRSYSGSIPGLVDETGAEDVILLNSLPITSDPSLVSDLHSVF